MRHTNIQSLLKMQLLNHSLNTVVDIVLALEGQDVPKILNDVYI